MQARETTLRYRDAPLVRPLIYGRRIASRRAACTMAARSSCFVMPIVWATGPVSQAPNCTTRRAIVRRLRGGETRKGRAVSGIIQISRACQVGRSIVARVIEFSVFFLSSRLKRLVREMNAPRESVTRADRLKSVDVSIR